MTRVQFILKHRNNYFSDEPATGSELSSGLFNSARLVEEMLRNELGVAAEIVHAIDNNSIDRLVTKFKPDIVVIEAYWVVPEKFAILTKLHPNVTWVVRNHSALPFAAMESTVVDWTIRYMDYPNVISASNDPRADYEFRRLISIYKPDWSQHLLDRRVILLPNYYPISNKWRDHDHRRANLDIGCFGAIRPLKNQLMQAFAAIEYANQSEKFLNFHINATRIEGRGEPILANLRRLFALMPNADLVEHTWMPHQDFLELVRTMDIGMQVSYSETFNIVTADMLTSGVPMVVSDEIPWVPVDLHARPNDSKSIIDGLRTAFKENFNPLFMHKSMHSLREYDDNSIKRWGAFIKGVMERV